MSNFNEVASRAKEVLGLNSDSDLCKIMGLSTSTFANRKRSGSIPWKELIPLLEPTGNSDYVLYGIDPLMKDAKSRHKPTNINNKTNGAADFAIKSIDGNALGIHVFDAEAACGAGFINDTACVIDTLFIDASLLRQHDVKAKDARVFRSRGDSMVPTVPVGVDVLIDISKKSATGGGVFAFRIDDECFIKRLMLDKTANQLHVMSDNTAYPKQLFSLNEGLDIEIIGKLKAYMKWF